MSAQSDALIEIEKAYLIVFHFTQYIDPVSKMVLPWPSVYQAALAYWGSYPGPVAEEVIGFLDFADQAIEECSHSGFVSLMTHPCNNRLRKVPIRRLYESFAGSSDGRQQQLAAEYEEYNREMATPSSRTSVHPHILCHNRPDPRSSTTNSFTRQRDFCRNQNRHRRVHFISTRVDGKKIEPGTKIDVYMLSVRNRLATNQLERISPTAPKYQLFNDVLCIEFQKKPGKFGAGVTRFA
ncbi:unnamed protein product [Bursaphelenchus xylophilus]|uniref:(pine wood nematode) hypothetical protein n=1 Tax=Bursaphelenchus xylophilus TaxID=6326 RepID=A0A1I7SB16_BURXY|nr:unnamed protein product [Bursaphelenchus xylophilus]CAG9105899.1 unnamed protein product [Bursaphelenchus xylophilus]